MQITLLPPSLLFNCEIEMLTKSNLFILISPNSPQRKGVTIRTLPFHRRENWRTRRESVRQSQRTMMGNWNRRDRNHPWIYFGALVYLLASCNYNNNLGSPDIALWYNRRNAPLPLRGAEQGYRSLKSVRTGTLFSSLPWGPLHLYTSAPT